MLRGGDVGELGVGRKGKNEGRSTPRVEVADISSRRHDAGRAEDDAMCAARSGAGQFGLAAGGVREREVLICRRVGCLSLDGQEGPAEPTLDNGQRSKRRH